MYVKKESFQEYGIIKCLSLQIGNKYDILSKGEYGIHRREEYENFIWYYK